MRRKDCAMDCRYRTSDGEKECEFQRRVIQVPDEWQGVRIQAAIAAMQGMLSNPNLCLAEGDTYPKIAVAYADELIKQLNEK